MTTREDCTRCGTPLEEGRCERVEKVGRYTVKDGTGVALHCPSCKAIEVPVREMEGYERRAAITVLRERRADNEVFRYARKALGVTQNELSKVLGCVPETVSRWENGGLEVPKAMQLAMVTLLDGVERGILSVERLVEGAYEQTSSTELEVRPAVTRRG